MIFLKYFCKNFLAARIFIIININLIALINALGISSDLELVEKLVVDVASEQNLLNKISVSKLKNKLFHHTACEMTNEEKLYFCQLYLEEDVYTLDITWPSLPSLKCVKQRYSLRILDEKILTTNTLPMYPCPPTNEAQFLGELPLFYISASRFHETAFVFMRKNLANSLHPHRFIDDFKFQQIKELSSTAVKYKSLKTVDEEPFRMLSRVSSMKLILPHVLKIVDRRRLQLPYTKFRSTYLLKNVCALSNTQILNLCRLIQTDKFTSQLKIEYDETRSLKCEKRKISKKSERPVSPGKMSPVAHRNLEITNRKWEDQVMPLIPCPLMVSSEEDIFYNKLRKWYSSVHYFLSTCLEKHCVVGYEFWNARDEKTLKVDKIPKVNCIFTGLDFEILDKTKEVERQLKYPSKGIENRKHLTTQLSFKRSEYPRVNQLDSNLKKVEEEVVTLFKILDMKLPYQKFRKTVLKMNICGLSNQKKKNLCTKTFGNQMYGYRIDTKDWNSIQCRRQLVLLNEYEMEKEMALLMCPVLNLLHYFGHYVTGGVSQNMAIMYSQSTEYFAIYPVASARQVDLNEV